jgi:hypothetical protein
MTAFSVTEAGDLVGKRVAGKFKQGKGAKPEWFNGTVTDAPAWGVVVTYDDGQVESYRWDVAVRELKTV